MKTKLSLFIVLFIYFPSILYSQATGHEPDERAKSYHVEHYKIEVKLDLQKKTLDGKVTASILSLKNVLDTIDVDAAGMNIKSVKALIYNQTDKPDLAESYENVKYSYNGNNLLILPFGFIRKNFHYKFQIEYSCTDPEKGLYFIAPDSLHPEKQYQAWTQGEGEDNHFWFPCYDYPNDKATTETIITIDKQYTTLSNGVLNSVKDNPDGTRTWDWSLDKPYSSYLVMLAAGKFDSIEDKYDDVPVYTYVPEGKKDFAFKSFDKTADIIHFFSDFTGYKYPWHRFSQVVVEDFIYGGMENTGAVVLTDVSLYDDNTPPDYTATGLVAHELAHQWWGDVVTCKNWNEIWLNEGFATYFDALYKEHTMGKDEFDYEMYKHKLNALTADSTTRRPIYTNHGITANTYDKGACVLDMLRYILGDDDFKQALNFYIKKNQFDNVTTPDLNAAIKQVFLDPTRDRIPRDFSWYFDEWIYNAGQPEYKTAYTYNDSAKQILFSMQQVQSFDSVLEFHMPVNVEIITPVNRFTQTIVPTYEPHTWIFSVDAKPLCVDANVGNKILCKLYYSKPEEDWLYQLNNSENAIDRITAIRGLKDFINDTAVQNALIAKLKYDGFWGVREQAAGMLSFAMNESVPDVLIAQYKDETDSRVRKAIMTSLGDFFNNCPGLSNKNSLLYFVTGLMQNEKSYYAIAEGITTISKIAKGDSLYTMVLPYVNKDSHNEIIRRSVLEAMIESKNENAIEYYIYYALHTSNGRLRGVALRGLEQNLNNSKVIDALDILISFHNPYTRNVSIGLLKKAANPVSKPYLEAELKKTYDENTRKSLQEAIDAIR
ncbi:MAG: M1 family aminopeptidase [Ignavibacteria bacterium]